MEFKLLQFLTPAWRGLQILSKSSSQRKAPVPTLIHKQTCTHHVYSYCGFLKFTPGQYRCKNSPEIYLDPGPQDVLTQLKNDKVRQDMKNRDFPGGPVVKTWSSKARGVGSIPDCRANIPHDSRPKNRNIKQKRYCNKFNPRL